MLSRLVGHRFPEIRRRLKDDHHTRADPLQTSIELGVRADEKGYGESLTVDSVITVILAYRTP
jgi:hypothetical protein